MRGLLVALACGFLLSGCATRSAGHRLYVPMSGLRIYQGRDFAVPMDPPLGAEEATRIEAMLEDGRVAEAYVAAAGPARMGGPGSVERLASRVNADYVRLIVAARRQTTGSWTPSKEEIAALERALGKLWKMPDQRIRGFPSTPTVPLSRFFVIYTGVTFEGKRFVVGRGDMGDASTLDQLEARYGSTGPDGAFGASMQYPAGGFRMLYDAVADEVIEVVFQGGA